MPFIYILRCSDNTLYVGHTDDLATREELHNRGHGAKYTASRTPVRIVYAEQHASLHATIGRERQLKRWSLKKKEALVICDRAALRSLGRKRTKTLAECTWRELLNRRP